MGAYNDDLEGTNYGGLIGEQARDYFKLKTVTVCPTPAVPVPGSVLLAFTGLALVRRFRKRIV